jgi:predicted HicB family RNase H-like nuclease
MQDSGVQPLTVRVPKGLHEAARIKSIQTHTSLNRVFIEKLAEWVKESASKQAKKQ